MKEYSYVLFDNYNTFSDFNLYIQKIEISEAEIKSESVDIPGGDGELDFTYALTGDAKFKNRKINITCANLKKYVTLQEYSRVQNALHGKRMKIILSKDLSFYYLGKVSVGKFEVDGLIRFITIECDVDPYKYDILQSNEDWLWDPFNFEDGIINETNNIEVSGTKNVVIYGRRKRVVPWITCDNTMQVVFNSQTYNLSAGRQKVLNIEICEGINTLKFIGNGTVTIEYRGGSL